MIEKNIYGIIVKIWATYLDDLDIHGVENLCKLQFIIHHLAMACLSDLVKIKPKLIAVAVIKGYALNEQIEF